VAFIKEFLKYLEASTPNRDYVYKKTKLANRVGRMNAQEVIKLFNLEPLRGEGGYFRRTYCSQQKALYHDANKPIVSSIYFLITADNFSALHILQRDEIFHFYAGDSIEFIQIKNSELETIMFGNNIAQGEIPQIVVEGNAWQALRISEKSLTKYGWSLVGTTVSPAFEYEDFIIGNRAQLLKEFPHLSATIERFTR
jgi:predicted cupin superfamily sugar epimerase